MYKVYFVFYNFLMIEFRLLLVHLFSMQHTVLCLNKLYLSTNHRFCSYWAAPPTDPFYLMENDVMEIAPLYNHVVSIYLRFRNTISFHIFHYILHGYVLLSHNIIMFEGWFVASAKFTLVIQFLFSVNLICFTCVG